jgi:hypothetical protein
MLAKTSGTAVSQMRILLGLFMELLRLLLQLLEAAFCVDVDGVLCDFALYTRFSDVQSRSEAGA